MLVGIIQSRGLSLPWLHISRANLAPIHTPPIHYREHSTPASYSFPFPIHMFTHSHWGIEHYLNPLLLQTSILPTLSSYTKSFYTKSSYIYSTYNNNINLIHLCISASLAQHFCYCTPALCKFFAIRWSDKFSTSPPSFLILFDISSLHSSCLPLIPKTNLLILLTLVLACQRSQPIILSLTLILMNSVPRCHLP